MPTPNDKTAPEPTDSGSNGNQGENLPDGALENIAAGVQDIAAGYSESDVSDAEERLKAYSKKTDEEIARLKKETLKAMDPSGRDPLGWLD